MLCGRAAAAAAVAGAAMRRHTLSCHHANRSLMIRIRSSIRSTSSSSICSSMRFSTASPAPWRRQRQQQRTATAAAAAASSAASASASASAAAAAAAHEGQPLQQQQQQQQQWQPPPPVAAYVHLPFCKRKCFYCDFPVEAVGARASGSARAHARMQAYVDVLLREVAATARLNDAAAEPLHSVYFGGGTPSLVPPPLLARILSAVGERFGIAPGAELTIEADPGTFDAALLAEFKALGFTRLSVGVQSLDDAILRACGRAHTAAEAAAALDAVAAAGFRSWSLDLMGGLPGLTRAGWRETLAAAAARAPPHVSVYDLQVEPGTPFARWYSPGAAPLPSDADAAGMYEDAVAALTRAGYEHYEVSSYASSRAHWSAHNQVYWAAGTPYYAFGVGAASYLAGRRFSRPKALGAYEAWVDAFEAAAAGGGGDDSDGPLPGVPGAKELPPESAEDRLLDAVMLGLRTSDGLDLAALAAAHGDSAARALVPALERHEKRGLVLLTRGASGGGGRGDVTRARLTDPRGFLVSNDVISDLFAAL